MLEEPNHLYKDVAWKKVEFPHLVIEGIQKGKSITGPYNLLYL